MKTIPHSAPTVGAEEERAATGVLRSGQLAQGAEVERFEQECARAQGRKYGVAVNSGTSALHLALVALGVPADSRVAIPSYSCAALVGAVQLHGGQPVLCDSGADYNLDPATVPEDCAAAIVPHLFGAPARLPEGCLVIEDIAQSFGGSTGKTSPVAITSFFATKLITTGEGGMLFMDDPDTAEVARDRRDYDNREDLAQRFNYKMTDLQAAIGRVQLERLPRFLEVRRTIAARYGEAFHGLPLRLPDADGHVFFRYVVGSDRRDGLEAHLRECDLEAKRPVYRPMHHHLGGEFPVAEAAYDTLISLPLFPSMTDRDVGDVIEAVEKVLHHYLH